MCSSDLLRDLCFHQSENTDPEVVHLQKEARVRDTQDLAPGRHQERRAKRERSEPEMNITSSYVK